MAKNKPDDVIVPNENGTESETPNIENVTSEVTGQELITPTEDVSLITPNETAAAADEIHVVADVVHAEIIPDKILMENDFILEIPVRLGVSVTVSLKAGQLVEDKNIIKHVIQSDANYQSE